MRAARRRSTRIVRRVARVHLSVGTPRALERRHRFRLSVSVWPLGFHWKLRTGTTFRHLKVGGTLMSAYGSDWNRLSFYAGVFKTVDGQRVSNHGIVATVALVSTTTGRHLPYAPERRKARMRERSEEA